MNISRTENEIKNDMLEWVKSNLKIRASDEWNYDIIEADPLINLLIEACASEAKRVYDAVQESDERVFNKVLRYLLPESFHYPCPAVGIMRAIPKNKVYQLYQEQSFKIKSEKGVFSFTPLWDTDILNAKIRYVGLDQYLYDWQDTKDTPFDKLEVSEILLGLESDHEIYDLRNYLYVDWLDLNTKYQFLQTISNAGWYLNDQKINVKPGFIDNEHNLNDLFIADLHLKNSVKRQYKLNFYLLSDNNSILKNDGINNIILNNWLRKYKSVNNSNKLYEINLNKKYIWVRIEFAFPIVLNNIRNNLVLELNCFPIVNRELIIKEDHETFISDSFGIEIINLKPNRGHFCGIHSVINLKSGEVIHPDSLYRLINDNEDKIKYTLRYGGVGRYDNLNLWQRLAYILTLFRQEQMEQKLIEKIGLKLSLEEIHEILGSYNNIKKSASAEESNGTDIYLIVNLGIHKKLDTSVKYWITDGYSANHINSPSSIYTDTALPGLEYSSLELIKSTSGGITEISSTKQSLLIQDAIFRKQRIVTKEDIKSLCYSKFGDKMINFQLVPTFIPDINNEGGIIRVMFVYIKVIDNTDPIYHYIGQEIECILLEESVASNKYQVKIL